MLSASRVEVDRDAARPPAQPAAMPPDDRRRQLARQSIARRPALFSNRETLGCANVSAGLNGDVRTQSGQTALHSAGVPRAPSNGGILGVCDLCERLATNRQTVAGALAARAPARSQRVPYRAASEPTPLGNELLYRQSLPAHFCRCENAAFDKARIMPLQRQGSFDFVSDAAWFGCRVVNEPIGTQRDLQLRARKRRENKFEIIEPLAKLPGDWGWAQSSALLVNTIALDRRLDILSGEPAARRR